ncbi:TonB-dependent receptor [Pseudoduganella lutea]|uniref:TonB-dependent receptor n=1 Tax=Pseudoduganella lutea TaxID=321985 RepID=A0A4P6KX48_9BURK|nr:TonB-dependent receptor [Pseudoduganella lutea]QBE63546.1 TonB-dependent receptor [Pseudoduganella lutea]
MRIPCNEQHAVSLRPAAMAVALAMTALATGNTWADQAPPATTAPDDGTRLETVIVTANKRAQNLQDVPAAVSVLNDASLQRNNVRDLSDLPSLSPALTINYGSQPANNSINMRGIGTYSLGIGVEADVSVIIDDIPVGMQANAFKDLADVHRIEVLKGPQSTLLGKSSIAGAINITTKPIESNWRTRTSTLATSDHEWRVSAATSGAISDTVRVRLAASRTGFPGVVKNLTDGKDLNGSYNTTVSAKLAWTPLDNLEIVLSPHANRSNANCCLSPYTSMTPGGLYQNIAQLPASQVLAGIPIGPGNVAVRTDYPAGGRGRDAGSGLKVAYTFADDSPLAGHMLSSITSYQSYRMDDFQDVDGLDADTLRYTLLNGRPSGFTGGQYQAGFFEVKSRTQELRLTSPDTGKLRYVAGLWYGDNRLERELKKSPVGPIASWYNAHARNTSYALFGQSSWEFASRTSLITGLRLNREDTGYDFTRFAPPPAGTRTPIDYLAKKDSNRDVTGKIGVEHHVDPDTMVYGLFSTGHKGVAYDLTSSLTAAIAAHQPVPAETAKNMELGAKLSLLDNRAMLNLAIFRTNFKGFQQSAGFIDPDGQYRTTLHSIGGLRTSGVEVDATWRASRELTVNGAFAFTRAIITAFENGPCYSVPSADGLSAVPGGNCAPNPRYNNTNVADLRGKTLPNAPKIKLNLGAQYDLPLPARRFDAFFTAAYRWQSATQFSLNQDPANIQGAYGIVNLGMGLKDRKDAYKLSFMVNNLLDKSYASGLANAVGSTWSVKAPNASPHLVNYTTWTPARDYQRYFTVRLDATF